MNDDDPWEDDLTFHDQYWWEREEAEREAASRWVEAFDLLAEHGIVEHGVDDDMTLAQLERLTAMIGVSK